MQFLVLFTMITNTVGYFPQIARIFRTKSAEDISIPCRVMWVLSSIADLLYYIYIDDLWLIISAVVNLACVMSIFVLSIIYHKRRTPVLEADNLTTAEVQNEHD